MRRLPCLFLALLTPLLLAGRAEAQECGSWREPVLCQIELQATDADRRWNRIDPNRELVLAPRTATEMEIRGRDQSGRTFPQYRLGLDFDDRECSSILQVEDLGEGRLRLTPSASQGRCRLEIWVPGNLNFAWRLDVSVQPGARASYARGESELIVNGLYRGLLGRDPDAGSFSSAVAEVQRGNLQALVRNMLGSQEFRQGLSATDPAGLLERLYTGLLDRSPDSTGVSTFLPQIQRGQMEAVVMSIITSAEFEDRLARVR